MDVCKREFGWHVAVGYRLNGQGVRGAREGCLKFEKEPDSVGIDDSGGDRSVAGRTERPANHRSSQIGDCFLHILRIEFGN